MPSERIIVTLACSECKNRNYHFVRARQADKKLGLKKYCRACSKHTLHKEVK